MSVDKRLFIILALSELKPLVLKENSFNLMNVAFVEKDTLELEIDLELWNGSEARIELTDLLAS